MRGGEERREKEDNRRERRERREERRKEKRKKREERKEKREERGEWVPHVMWTPHQHLIVILISFDHFNGLSYGKG